MSACLPESIHCQGLPRNRYLSLAKLFQFQRKIRKNKKQVKSNQIKTPTAFLPLLRFYNFECFFALEFPLRSCFTRLLFYTRPPRHIPLHFLAFCFFLKVLSTETFARLRQFHLVVYGLSVVFFLALIFSYPSSYAILSGGYLEISMSFEQPKLMCIMC